MKKGFLLMAAALILAMACVISSPGDSGLGWELGFGSTSTGTLRLVETADGGLEQMVRVVNAGLGDAHLTDVALIWEQVGEAGEYTTIGVNMAELSFKSDIPTALDEIEGLLSTWFGGELAQIINAIGDNVGEVADATNIAIRGPAEQGSPMVILSAEQFDAFMARLNSRPSIPPVNDEGEPE